MTAAGYAIIALASCTLLLGCETPSDDGITNPAAQSARDAQTTSNISSWSEPVSLGAAINTAFSDAQPALSKNGLTLYFTSQRPEHSADVVLDNNIWVARRACIGCAWQEPVILGPVINSAGNDASPVLSRDDHQLFFTTNRPGSQGNDIWVASRRRVRDDFGWETPVNLGPGVNTAANETGASHVVYGDDAEGRAQLFFNRQMGPANIPAGDIYVSDLSADGTWGPASLVAELNSAAADQKPSIHRNGLQIYFWSGRDAGRGTLGDAYLWQASRDRVEEPWSVPELVASPISDHGASQPFIHARGHTETLLFVRNIGTAAQQNLDIFMSTRNRGNGDDDEDDDHEVTAADSDSDDENDTDDGPPRYTAWSAPVNLGPTVNSAAFELELSLSRKGRTLFLASNRAGSYDILVSQRTRARDPWGQPQSLGPIINTAAREQAPFLSLDGRRLYFFSDRPGGVGGTDLYVSRRQNEKDDFSWSAPENLGDGVNGGENETLPVVFEDEPSGTTTLFFTLNRSVPGDIYSSRLLRGGVFEPAVLVSELNSAGRDRILAIRRDGLEVFLASDRAGPIGSPFDLWVATRATTSDRWSAPVNLGTVVNSPFDEGGAALSFDGTILYVTSNRPGGSGLHDVWSATRSRLREDDRNEDDDGDGDL